MRKHLTLSLLLALLLAPGALAGQQDASARIRAAVERAAGAGIPASLLESRIAEGRAKGVPLDRIASAVERRSAALLEARGAMSGARPLREAELAAGADAIEAGVGGEALRSVIQEARRGDGAVAIAVLTFLHREQGIPVEQALQQVTEALRRGPEALRSLPSQAAAARGRRGPPAGAGPPDGVPGPGGNPGGRPPRGRGGPTGGGALDG